MKPIIIVLLILIPAVATAADVPMITISQILRHRNLGTTERYLKRLGGLKEALETLKRPKEGVWDT